MAISLCFGLMLSTVLVLLLVPTFFSIYARLRFNVSMDDSDNEVSDLDGNGSRVEPKPADELLSEPLGIR
jgi:hypothetical protein